MTDLYGFTLPDGYTLERPSFEPDCIMIGKNGCWVSIDMRKRFFGLGYAKPRRFSTMDGKPGFSGAGWQRRLLSAAVDFLASEVD